ncbi:SMP-30/gluconolactonase/LRE family protein [Gimesia aquarii]|uniref:Gluconolactonase n=1 Tax=Gimesia aquarii TaxID=2527964 RepID=A0A517X012_9PLAN|nr:SMP-30/gluconolactonase/LRE family protein [Gimesia aquarii]QDU10842.1 Gluconolactonase precursor [Gimesia aquarii]
MAKMTLTKVYDRRLSFFEGPAYGAKGPLYFSNYPYGEIWQYNGKKATKKCKLKQKAKVNGLFMTTGGTLWGCDMKQGQIVTIDLISGAVKERACEYKGNRLDDPNDLIMDKTGGVYFSCPGIGPINMPWPWPSKAKRGVYYLSPRGRVKQLLLEPEIHLPNGVMLSPDESNLYVVQNGLPDVYKYEILAPGKLGQRKKFCTLYDGKQDNEGGDGLTVDRKGNVYIATRKGVEVFSTKGKSLHFISLPSTAKVRHVSNVTFGSKNLDTLFATAYQLPRSGLFAIQLDGVQGHVFPGCDPK